LLGRRREQLFQQFATAAHLKIRVRPDRRVDGLLEELRVGQALEELFFGAFAELRADPRDEDPEHFHADRKVGREPADGCREEIDAGLLVDPHRGRVVELETVFAAVAVAKRAHRGPSG
jgi:hypothetical protein